MKMYETITEIFVVKYGVRSCIFPIKLLSV